jgi:FkbM family methyltransferase
VSGSGLKKLNNPPVFITRDNVKFLVQETGFRQIYDIPEYRFDDLCPTDRVIDIGANAGAFCIRASRRSQNVVAVEPLTAALLRENILLNGVSVQVIEGALGDGKPKTIRWDDTQVFTQTYPLRKIIKMAGGCDFLKCDCEGAEWSIEPEDLHSVHRIEMELHLPPISGPPNPALLDYISSHYHFEIEQKPVHTTLGVMGVLHAARKT